MPTRREVFVNGILGYDFQTVYEIFGATEAIEWGERCARMSDYVRNGETYPLTGFSFQLTFEDWKKDNPWTSQ